MSRAVSGSHVGISNPDIDPSPGVRSWKFAVGTFLFNSLYPVHAYNGFGTDAQYYIRITSARPPITYAERTTLAGPDDRSVYARDVDRTRGGEGKGVFEAATVVFEAATVVFEAATVVFETK